MGALAREIDFYELRNSRNSVPRLLTVGFGVSATEMYYADWSVSDVGLLAGNEGTLLVHGFPRLFR